LPHDPPLALTEVSYVSRRCDVAWVRATWMAPPSARDVARDVVEQRLVFTDEMT
jgi:hypothetical protein